MAMHKRRLKTLSDVRRWIADVANRLENGEIDSTHAKTAGYLASILSSVIQTADLEARVQALEAQSKKGGQA